MATLDTRILALTLLFSAARLVSSQDTTRTDTAAVDAVPRFMSAMSFGSLAFDGGRTERATSASIRIHFTRWLSTAVAPSFVFASEPGLSGTVNQSGLADVPVQLSASFALPLPLSPRLDFAMSATLPVGDTATGLGAGQVGYSAAVAMSLSPASRFSVHGGAGRSLTAISTQGMLNGSASMWGYAGAVFALPAGFSFGADYNGDLGSVDPALGRSSSLSVGLGLPAASLGSVTVDVAHGLSGPTPTWGVALRVGLDYAGLASAGRRAPSAELESSFGAGPHGLAVTPHGNKPANAGGGTGNGSGNGKGNGKGNGSTGSTTGSSKSHGRGKQP